MIPHRHRRKLLRYNLHKEQTATEQPQLSARSRNYPRQGFLVAREQDKGHPGVRAPGHWWTRMVMRRTSLTRWPYTRETTCCSGVKQELRPGISQTGRTSSMSLCTYYQVFDDSQLTCSGACYVIMSKAKGWYIVQRDPRGAGNITPDQSKSGWVPAGEWAG